jgi:cation-transporting ATPase F
MLKKRMRQGPPARVVWHGLGWEEVLAEWNTRESEGLRSEDIERRRERHGWNRIEQKAGVPAWLRLLKQFHQPLIYILLAAAGVTLFLGEHVESGVILGVVLVNAMVGALQEGKAERAIASLARMTVSEATVRRDGQERRIPAVELVPGDMVILEAGDRVPADLRLGQIRSLKVDESLLTGESLPVNKHTAVLPEDTLLGDRVNLAFSGSLVTGGQGLGVVFATGGATETGKIAEMVRQTVPMETPLTRNIARFSRLLLGAILALAVATFFLGVWRGQPPAEMFMAAVALAVGAIPEGLPAAVTIVLAIGVARMAKRRAIIRKLPAVETLGSTTVICSDKTGTLTENQMTVQRVWAGGRRYAVSGVGLVPKGSFSWQGETVRVENHPALGECLRAGVLCNDAHLYEQNGAWRMQGDPTEVALMVAGAKAGLCRRETHERFRRVDEIPFDSEHMYRATLHETGRERMIYKIGATEKVLARCTRVFGDDGSQEPMDRGGILAEAEAMGADGLRVLALARKETAPGYEKLGREQVADGLTFLGLQAMMDPPRPEAKKAIARCVHAGIAVKMITGDHLATARAIARQLGMTGPSGEAPLAMDGRELAAVPEGDLPGVVEETQVFARVAPEQKLRLVRALQARSQVVAMTGDGVNDAPALRQADIGVAMGKNGTEVAKEAASMILTDDNFASIEAAVEEGRGVFDNLTKFIVWTLPTNAAEALVIFTAILMGWVLPILPVQLLWINMGTALLLGMTLAFEPKERDLMNRPPRHPQQPILTLELMLRTFAVGLLIAAGVFWLHFYEQSAGGDLAAIRTTAVNAIVLAEVAYLFSCRSLRQPLVQMGWLENPWVLTGVLAMVAAQLLFTYLPVMNRLFGSAPISWEAWMRIGGVAVATFVLVEMEKIVRTRWTQRKRSRA